MKEQKGKWEVKRMWNRLFSNPQVIMDLQRLHPGVEREKLQRDYYKAKCKKALLIALGGTLLAVLLAVRAVAERKMNPENVIVREGVTGDIQELELQAQMGEAQERFRIQVQPAKLGDEEAEIWCRRFCDELPSLILGKNESLDAVRGDLRLEEAFEGYPFSVEWKSENVDVITSSGEVHAQDEECEVVLTAEIEYGELVWEKVFWAKVLPPLLTEEEKRHKEIEALLVQSEEDGRFEEEWRIPDEWQGEKINWSRVVDNYSLLLWVIALLVAGIVFFLADRDLHGEVEKRKDKMKLEYPDIVHKLVLYLGAGLTLRGAFQKIAAEYEKGRAGGKPEGAAYEEILYMCRELQAGVSEASAYEHFGKRTGLQEYIRLTTLLAQNLKKGNSTLLQRLREEADKASLERIQGSRRLGEEASTKLLVPMVMMLAVVMVMVMLPALTSMGGA